MDLVQNKVCIITGGTGGIGYVLASGFLEKGYQVVVLDIDIIRAVPEGAAFIQVDLRDEQQVIDAFKEISSCYGTIHVLINNAAATYLKNKPITEVSLAEFDDLISVNLRGAFLCCQQFILYNSGQNYGRIINISSTRCNQNEADWESYGCSKGGLVALTNSLAVSLGETPITVNAVSPGWICVDDYDELSDKDHLQHPSGRVGVPDDVLNACLFLADEKSDFINAVNLVVDGGMSKKMVYYSEIPTSYITEFEEVSEEEFNGTAFQ